MGKPSNSQTTVILPDAPSLLLYSLSLTPLRNYAAEFDAVFNYTPPPAQEQTNPVLRDIESMLTRLNERLDAREAYLSTPSDNTLSPREGNVARLQDAVARLELELLLYQEAYQKAVDLWRNDNTRLLTSYRERTGNWLTDPNIAIEEQKAYEGDQIARSSGFISDLIGPVDPRLNMSPEYRRATGLFTLDEMERAREMNQARSASLWINSFMPNFGEDFARAHPMEEMTASREAAKLWAKVTLGGIGATLGAGATAADWAALGNLASRAGNWTVRNIVLPELAAQTIELGATAALGYSPFLNFSNWLKGKGWNPYLADFTAYSLNPGYMVGGGFLDNAVTRLVGPTFLTATKALERLFFDNYITNVSGERLVSDINSGYSNKFLPWLLKYIFPFYGKNNMNYNMEKFSINPDHPVFRIPRASRYKAVLTTPPEPNYYLPHTNYGGLVTNALGTAAGIDLINNYDNRPAWISIPELYLASRVPTRYLVLLKMPLLLELVNRLTKGLSLLQRLSDKWSKLLRGDYASITIPMPPVFKNNYNVPQLGDYLADKITAIYGESVSPLHFYPTIELMDNLFLERFGHTLREMEALHGYNTDFSSLYKDIIARDHGYKNFLDLKHHLNEDYLDTYLPEILLDNIVFTGRSGNKWYFKDISTGRYSTFRTDHEGISPEHNFLYKMPVSFYNRTVDLNRISLENMRLLANKYPNLDISENLGIFSINGTPAFKINPLTGKLERINDLSLLPPSVPLETFDIAGNRLYLGEIKVNNGVLEFPQEYSDVLSSNVNLIRNMLGVPDLKLYGSTAAITGARFPHNAHDMEFLATPELFKIIQNNPLFKNAKQKRIGTYTIEIPVGNLGRTQEVDINIVDANPRTGYALGTRAEELFRLYYPDLYSDAVRERGAGNPFVIPYTPLLLLDNVDPTTKTIMDSFSINPLLDNKSKHLLRPFMHIVYSDPIAVLNGLHQYGKSLLGENVRFFPMEATQLTDPEVNMLALRKLGIGLLDSELEAIANDPIRMKNLLDYWFITDRTYNRYVLGTWPELLGGKGKYVIRPEYFKRSATSWFANEGEMSNKGNHRGLGENVVYGGDSGFIATSNALRALVQPLIDFENTDNLLALIDEINLKLGGILNAKDLPLIEGVFNELGIPASKIYDNLLWLPGGQMANSENLLGIVSGNALMDIQDHIFRNNLGATDIYNILGRLYDRGIYALASPKTPKEATPGSVYASLMYTINPHAVNIGFTPITPNLSNISLNSRLVKYTNRPSTLSLPDISNSDPNTPILSSYFNTLYIPKK